MLSNVEEISLYCCFFMFPQIMDLLNHEATNIQFEKILQNKFPLLFTSRNSKFYTRQIRNPFRPNNSKLRINQACKISLFWQKFR